MSESWEALMNQTAGKAERPRNVPEGHWTLEFEKIQKRSAVVNDDTVHIMRAIFIPVSPLEDVDTEELEDFDASKKRVHKDFWLRKDEMYRVDDFLKITMGLGELNGNTYEESFDSVVGKECVGQIEHREDEANERTYVDIKTLAPAKD